MLSKEDDNHADRSWTGGLALCRGAGTIRLGRNRRSQPVVVQPPRARRRAGGGSVRRPLRILDLLPAPLTASNIGNGPEVSGHHGRAGRPGCPRHPAKAAQPDHGHLSPEPGALGLHPTVILMFSHIQVVLLSQKVAREARPDSGKGSDSDISRWGLIWISERQTTVNRDLRGMSRGL